MPPQWLVAYAIIRYMSCYELCAQCVFWLVFRVQHKSSNAQTEADAERGRLDKEIRRPEAKLDAKKSAGVADAEKEQSKAAAEVNDLRGELREHIKVDRAAELQQAFKQFDIDGDSTIGFDELLALGTCV